MKEERTLKLVRKKDGHGNLTSFTVNISKNEAIKLGWYDEKNDTLKEIIKNVLDDKIILKESEG